MKNILLLLVGALIPVSLASLGFIYIKMTMPTDTWSPQNRNMLYESYSPNKKYKIGVYNYDMGALGYTAVQVSMVGVTQQYPSSGNVLRDSYIEPVRWLTDNKAEFSVSLKDNLHASVIMTIERQ